MTLQEAMNKIQPVDEYAVMQSQRHWDSIAKPLGSLGKLERAITQIAGIQRTSNVQISKKGLVIMCADNGVVREGGYSVRSGCDGCCCRKFSG